jgi:hypothetical protein
MGRPRLYSTELEQQTAIRARKARYYARYAHTPSPMAPLNKPNRNRDSICNQMRKRYHRHQEMLTLTPGAKPKGKSKRSPRKGSTTSSTAPERQVHVYTINRFAEVNHRAHHRAHDDPLSQLSATVATADEDLLQITAGDPAAYAALVYNQCLDSSRKADNNLSHNADAAIKDTCCSEVVGDSISQIEALFAPVHQSLDGILQIDGVGPAYQAADAVAKRFRNVLGFLEDLKSEALLGRASLAVAHRKGSLLYQLGA